MIHFPKSAGCGAGSFNINNNLTESSELVNHLKSMKKIKTLNSKGAYTYSWINTGADHYAHALNYLYCAWSSVENRPGPSNFTLLPNPKGLTLKS
jgi:hypothetical protein